MMTAKFFQDFSKQFSESLPPILKNLPHGFNQTMTTALELAVSKLNLIPREEFDVQTEQLARAQAKIKALEHRLAHLEQLIESSQKDGTL